MHLYMEIILVLKNWSLHIILAFLLQSLANRKTMSFEDKKTGFKSCPAICWQISFTCLNLSFQVYKMGIILLTSMCSWWAQKRCRGDKRRWSIDRCINHFSQVLGLYHRWKRLPREAWKRRVPSQECLGNSRHSIPIRWIWIKWTSGLFLTKRKIVCVLKPGLVSQNFISGISPN